MSDALADELLAGDRRAVARAISRVEQGTAAGLQAAIAPLLGRAHVLGITGAPGAGKSTLVDALLGALLARGERVGIVAVDPSSPRSGGALLGDRVRIGVHGGEPNVYIRSLASRGHPGGLSRATRGAVDVLDAAGFDTVIVETVGAGQSEFAIAGLADTCIVVCPPGLGDEVQALKAGILEVADLLVVSKSDLPGAKSAVRDLRQMLQLRPAAAGGGWQVEALPVAARAGVGLDALVARIDAHAQHAGRGRRLRHTSDGAGDRTTPAPASPAGPLPAVSDIAFGSEPGGITRARLHLGAAHRDAEGRCLRSVVFALADAAWERACRGRAVPPGAAVEVDIAFMQSSRACAVLIARAGALTAAGGVASCQVEVFDGDGDGVGQSIAHVAFRAALN